MSGYRVPLIQLQYNLQRNDQIIKYVSKLRLTVATKMCSRHNSTVIIVLIDTTSITYTMNLAYWVPHACGIIGIITHTPHL